MLPRRLTLGIGDILKEWNLREVTEMWEREPDAISAQPAPWSLCVRMCELLMSLQAPSLPAPDAAVWEMWTGHPGLW
jgi:hypothetical protein